MTITRSNYKGSVSLFVENLPVGVTATFVPAELTGSEKTSTLTLSAANGAVLGPANLTVRASTALLTAKTAAIALTVNLGPSYSLSLSAPSATIVGGGSAAITVNIVRIGGFSGAVALSVASLPAGVSATIEPSLVTGNSAVLTITAATPIASASYELSIRGASAGFAEQAVKLAVNSLRVGIPLAMNFCASDRPIWFAYRMENGPWIRVTPSGNAFKFSADGKISVAYVQPPLRTTVVQATALDLQPLTQATCQEDLAPNSFTGSVRGVSTNQFAIVMIGKREARRASTFTPNWAFSIDVPEGAVDLVGVVARATGSEGYTSDRVIIRRGMDLMSGTALPPLDFAGDEAFAPSVVPVTLAVDGTDRVNTWSDLLTAGGTKIALFGEEDAKNGNITGRYVPAGKLVTGDLQSFWADAFNFSTVAGRTVSSYFRTASSIELQLGPVLAPATTTVIASTPHLQMRTLLPWQAEYNSGIVITYEGAHYVTLLQSAAFNGTTGAAWDVTTPDLSGAPGYDPSWALSPGQTPRWATAFAASRFSLLLGAPPKDGDFLRQGYSRQSGLQARSPNSRRGSAARLQ